MPVGRKMAQLIQGMGSNITLQGGKSTDGEVGACESPVPGSASKALHLLTINLTHEVQCLAQSLSYSCAQPGR